MTVRSQLIQELQSLENKLDQVAREIYYAMQLHKEGGNPLPNLQVALTILGVRKPSDVGLSDRIVVIEPPK